MVHDDGDCCPRCDRHGRPCSAAPLIDAAAGAPCYFRGRLVPARRRWHPDTADACTVCQCLVRTTASRRVNRRLKPHLRTKIYTDMAHTTEVMAIFVRFFAHFGQQFWLSCPLDPCNEKYLLWIGRPLKPYHRTKKFVNNWDTQACLSPFSRYLTLNVFFHRSSGNKCSAAEMGDRLAATDGPKIGGCAPFGELDPM